MDSSLLNRIKNGDMSAFDAILDNYQPLINKEALMILDASPTIKDHVDIDDLKQEAAIALYSAACSYNDSAVTFGLYAKICVHNRLVSYIRKHKKHIHLTVLPLGGSDESEESLLTDDHLSHEEPESTLLASERVKQIIKFLSDGITDYEKRVFSLYLDSYSYAEIAKIVGRDAKSVDNAISRVKNKIRETFL